MNRETAAVIKSSYFRLKSIVVLRVVIRVCAKLYRAGYLAETFANSNFVHEPA